MVRIIQPSMGGGEISAAIGARVDLAKRAVSVELAENFVAKFSGGMESRAGLEFVARAKGSGGNKRLIPFEFNTEQTFVLEFGEQYVRFHTLGNQILNSNLVTNISGITNAAAAQVTALAHGMTGGDEIYISGVGGMTELNGRNFIIDLVTTNSFNLKTLDGVDVNSAAFGAFTSGGTVAPVYEVATPYSADDLFEITFGQSGDVMTLCHNDYTPQELVRLDNDDWTLTDVELLPSMPYPFDMQASVRGSVTTGSITAISLAAAASVSSSGHGLTTGDRIYMSDPQTMIELQNTSFVVDVTSANAFTIANHITEVDVDSTTFTAFTGTGTWTKTDSPRYYTVTAVDADNLEESLRGNSKKAPAIASITKADPCVVTTVGGHGLNELDHVELDAILGMTELNGLRVHARPLNLTQFALDSTEGVPIDSTNFTTYISGGAVYPLFVEAIGGDDTKNNIITWVGNTGATRYRVYASTTLGQFGRIGETTNLSFEDTNADPDYTVGPPVLFDPFADPDGLGDNNPAATGFFQQRRVFANTLEYPNRFYMTQAGNFDNFTRSYPLQDDDAIINTIAARRINSVRHVVPLTDLILLTGGGEYRVYSETGVFTPSSISVKPQSYYGTTSLRPLVAGPVALFMSAGEFVRDLTYQFADDKFIGKDLSILARHLFNGYTIVDWDYSPSPHAEAWCVRNDGIALCLTYQPDQDVYAWTRHTTDGDFKSTCSIREGAYDIPYFIVERVVNGTSIKYIERMTTKDFSQLSDAFCVDGGLTYDDPIIVQGYTSTNPVVVTAQNHGFANGDIVDLRDIQSADDSTRKKSISSEVNGTGYTIANVTTDTFELTTEGTDVDGTAFAAYSSGGEARKAVTTISGLWHLEGASVVAAANGYAEDAQTVTNGTITLSTPASTVHIGLPYTCRLITLPLTTYADGGQSAQGRPKNINRMTVQVERTMGMWYGPTVDQMREAKFGLPSLYGQPLEMLTEDIDVTMKADWGKKKQIVIEQRDPLPITILALVPDVNYGGQ